MDLAVEWRERRWARLLDLIDRLPRNSAYVEAICDDEMVAQRVLDSPTKEAPGPRRRMSEYSPVVETLSLLVDRISELITTVAASKGVKPRKIPPAPRPVTALERLRKKARQSAHRRMVSKLLPHKAHAPEPEPAPAAPPGRHRIPPRSDPPAGGRDLLRRSGWRDR